MSRMSCTPAGLSTGIIATDEFVLREPCGSVEERQAWSSAASASTPPCFEVPAALPCLNTSPQRSTPGPLPYHMREHAVDLRAREQVGLLRAPDHGRAEVLVEARGELHAGRGFRCFFAFHSSRSKPPSGEPR